MATAGITPAQAGATSAPFNMTRSLGGSVGVATLGTAVETLEYFHFSVMAERVPQNAGCTAEPGGWLVGIGRTRGWGTGRAGAEPVRGQAFVMAYSDAFAVVSIMLLLSLTALP